MGRSIDADALIEAFDPSHDCDWYTPSIIETIKEQPTAYDPEAVTQQLKEKAFPDFEEEYTCNGGLLLHYDDVIEIVRNGGVKNDIRS